GDETLSMNTLRRNKVRSQSEFSEDELVPCFGKQFLLATFLTAVVEHHVVVMQKNR
ncbi:hypothetical protein ACJX0J_029667, partial [Zea mays]